MARRKAAGRRVSDSDLKKDCDVRSDREKKGHLQLRGHQHNRTNVARTHFPVEGIADSCELMTSTERIRRRLLYNRKKAMQACSSQIFAMLEQHTFPSLFSRNMHASMQARSLVQYMRTGKTAFHAVQQSHRASLDPLPLCVSRIESPLFSSPKARGRENLPACLYYTRLLLIVHYTLWRRRLLKGGRAGCHRPSPSGPLLLLPIPGVTFAF